MAPDRKNFHKSIYLQSQGLHLSLVDYVSEALPRRKDQIFTSGELNKIIDSLLHPMAKVDMRYWAADLFFHAVVEQDPSVTVQKFIRYDVPKIAEQYFKQNARKKRKRNRY